MISTLWTGIAGLSSQQTALDNESNNIANVNTVGYKSSRVSFADLMYQDSIGKGSKVTTAEKQFTQGSLNITGSSYDMALNGDGFFVVSNKSSTGTSENYYTRAGNFRMGENGTLQDSNGNEVQGWALSAIDPETDVTSTNNNLTSFTDVFTEIAGNQIVQFSDRVETYAAKTTDYSATAVGDASELSGSGVKSQATKISDIESLITNYSSALSDYALDPEALSTPSIAQSTMIDLLPVSTTTQLSSEGNQIYVYINGNKITQNYVDSSASTEQKAALDASGVTTDLDGIGGTSTEEYNILVSRIATYQALADKISNITGLNAYTVKTTTLAGVDTYTASTDYADVLDGKIKIDSIIPGKAFTIGDLSEVNGSTEQDGTKTTVSENVVGTGESAVTSAMEALRDAVAGNQLDAYMPDDIFSDDTGAVTPIGTGDIISFSINGNVASVTAAAGDTEIELMDSLIAQINLNGDLNLLVEAQNINGNLVIKSKTAGEEFTGILKFTDASTLPAATEYTKDRNIDVSGNTGAGAEFMEIVSTVKQSNATLSSLQLKMDSLGLTDSSFGEFSVDDTGLITMKQDGMDYVIGQVAIAQFNNNIGLDAKYLLKINVIISSKAS
ncbi:flagellar hook-basal body complex protein [Arcobacter acticola]|uniref:flagellar hook-basal body complex protein n=1 Tax=Arcobacter acticola TaxID=1849015 RepID=UPI001551FBCA|nr:flagellar hook-basal body complex protein [Arcobacter acticola]